MALRAWDLITDELLINSYLGITIDSSNRGLIEALIKSATDFIEGQLVREDVVDGGYCNRRFKQTTYTSAKYVGNGRNLLFLRQYPIISITTIVIDDTTIFPSGSSTLKDLGFYIDNCTNSGFIYDYTWDYDEERIPNVEITYSAGYSTIPMDLQLACLGLVALKYNLMNAEHIKQERLGDQSYTLADLTKDSPFGTSTIQSVLDKYRNV